MKDRIPTAVMHPWAISLKKMVDLRQFRARCQVGGPCHWGKVHADIRLSTVRPVNIKMKHLVGSEVRMDCRTLHRMTAGDRCSDIR